MQPIQKFSDYFKGYQTTQEAIREADLQKEYGEVFMSLLKKYGVNSPAELDEEKKKQFFDEIGELYKKGEGQTAKGEDLVDTEKPEPVKEEDKEEEEEEKEKPEPVKEEDKEEEEEEEEEDETEEDEEGVKIPKKEDEETSAEIEDEIEDLGEPKDSEGKDEEVPTDTEETEIEVTTAEEDPDAGTEVDKEEDADTSKEIEDTKVEMGKPKKVVMSFDEFVSSKNESTTKGEESELEDEDLDDVDEL